ncbi:MAG TPA: DUF1573 domain-containing protein [Deltaproteobacteria bacterium]|nr:DUF1573 domain-containing protein [Deltaproteobacteria bacterium]
MLRFVKNTGMFIAIIVVFAAGNVYCSPRIKVDNPIFDAGEVPQGKDISHEFTIENIGDETLSITVSPC